VKLNQGSPKQRQHSTRKRNKLVNYYIWSTVVIGAETWTFQKIVRKCLKRFGSLVLEKVGEDQLDISREKLKSLT
jgi:hypothetical protein